MVFSSKSTYKGLKLLALILVLATLASGCRLGDFIDGENYSAMHLKTFYLADYSSTQEAQQEKISGGNAVDNASLYWKKGLYITHQEWFKYALLIADYLLNQQNADGAIPDIPNGENVNTDSDMEYALIGIAAAYKRSGDLRYLYALEKGIRWLAAREEMVDPQWRGSWFYSISSTPHYNPIPTSPGNPAIVDVRGVSATSALFVYLLYLYSVSTGSNELSLEYESNARAALDFILTHNQSSDGFFYSSWQKWASDNQWHLWPFRYAADQGDVYLGMEAGSRLYGDMRYYNAAKHLQEQVSTIFFDVSQKRYAMGIYEDGSFESKLDGFNGIFPQGYLIWVFGKNSSNYTAFRRLSSCVQPDGSLICYPGDPGYSLSVSLYILSAFTLGRPFKVQSIDWLIANTFDKQDGGVRDTRDPNSVKFPNVAGFTIMALLGFPAFSYSIPSKVYYGFEDKGMACKLNVKNWAIQLQNANPNEIAVSGFEFMVIDYSKDGSEHGKYSLEEIRKMKDLRVMPIAYLSIGEAENYRFYWKKEWQTNPPQWLGKENSEWKGNYAVKYWHKEWKTILHAYLDKIIEQGFCGIYLDKVDEFEYWANPNNNDSEHLSESESARRMIDLIIDIANYSRSKTGANFYIIPQNGEKILKYDNGTLMNIVSGWAAESLFYNGTKLWNEEEKKWILENRLPYLDMVLSKGNPVFSVDYVDDGSGYLGVNKIMIDDYRKNTLKKGYIPYAAIFNRKLDKLNIIKGIQP